MVTPPSGSQSPLAFSVTQLLSSGCHADMWFVLDSNSAHETGCLDCEMNSKEGSVEIPAHRVIIAARCDWFKRALLSGMKESIERFVWHCYIRYQCFCLGNEPFGLCLIHCSLFACSAFYYRVQGMVWFFDLAGESSYRTPARACSANSLFICTAVSWIHAASV